MQDAVREAQTECWCRPQWADLQQREGEPEARYRERLLGLGLHFRLDLQAKGQPPARQAPAAGAMGGGPRPVLPAPPTEAATAAAPEAEALAAQLAPAQGASGPGSPIESPEDLLAVCCSHPSRCTQPTPMDHYPLLWCNVAHACRLQALYQTFRRATEQHLKDKLQEQRVGVLPYPKHRLLLFFHDLSADLCNRFCRVSCSADLALPLKAPRNVVRASTYPVFT